MNRALLAIIALYVIWRLAVMAGRRRERQRQASFPFAGRAAPGRCDRCGRVAGQAELRWQAGFPWRRRVCRAGCPPHGAGEDDAGQR